MLLGNIQIYLEHLIPTVGWYIQWGDCIIKIGSIEQDVDFPISFKSYGFCSVGILQESSDTVIIKYMDKHTTASTIRFRLSQVSSGVDTWIKFLSIGK